MTIVINVLIYPQTVLFVRESTMNLTMPMLPFYTKMMLKTQAVLKHALSLPTFSLIWVFTVAFRTKNVMNVRLPVPIVISTSSEITMWLVPLTVEVITLALMDLFVQTVCQAMSILVENVSLNNLAGSMLMISTLQTPGLMLIALVYLEGIWTVV